ncbi:hypothetical protein FB451DRAFT_1191699 [Mycena latifolia]|nr:hypothetical protein FB451DRAFT_1191699 [Mycena latifolia]
MCFREIALKMGKKTRELVHGPSPSRTGDLLLTNIREHHHSAQARPLRLWTVLGPCYTPISMPKVEYSTTVQDSAEHQGQMEKAKGKEKTYFGVTSSMATGACIVWAGERPPDEFALVLSALEQLCAYTAAPGAARSRLLWTTAHLPNDDDEERRLCYGVVIRRVTAPPVAKRLTTGRFFFGTTGIKPPIKHEASRTPAIFHVLLGCLGSEVVG